MNHRYRLLLVLAVAVALIVGDGMRRRRGMGEGDHSELKQSSFRDAKVTAVRPPAPTPESDEILVNADGRDYRWRFRFAGPDGDFGTVDDISVGNELRLPADATVHLTVTSCDNVYVFSVPSLQLRRIAVPELTYRLDFSSGMPREHAAIMDPMCGAPPWYGPTMGRIQVVSSVEFNYWFQAVQKGRVE